MKKKKHLLLLLLLLTTVNVFGQIDANAQRDQLYQSFLTPPDSIRVGCYYYWINECVDPKGVKADLQWMKDNGITLAFLATDICNSLQGDTTKQIYGKNKFQSKLWWKNLRTALKTAGELGIEMGIFNCPGWSQSGGPWIKPEEAMRNWTPNGIEVCKTKEGTDVVCSPCSPEATGLEVDKLSKTHVKKHFEAFFGEILRRIPPKDRPTLTTVVVDSWERGKQNYTDSIFVKFKQRYGYELDYQNEACQKDLNQLIADLVASEYMGGLTEKAHEYGLRTWCEPYAHSPFPANSITYGGAADEVGAEFWVDDKKFRKKEVDAALGSARRSGKNRVWAESFTDGWPELAKDDWSFENLKPIADRYFHAGINASILHVVISQPGDDREPAVRPWFGTYFDRRSAHAADVKPLVEYLRRCNFMLQLGKPYNNATDQRIMDDGTIVRFTDNSQFEITFPNGIKEIWNPVTTTATQENLFQGKTIVVIGDSYVRNHRRPMEETWHARVAERLGMNYHNYGRNGNSIAFDRSKRGFGKSMLERYKEMTDTADFVLVIAGHNDAFMIGSSGDSLKLFRQRLDSLCTDLRQKYPQAAIGFVTPWAVERPGFAEVTQTIREVCANHDFPVLDAARTSGIQPMDTTFRKKYFQGINDTAHLNGEGHALLLDWGERFLRIMAEQRKMLIKK